VVIERIARYDRPATLFFLDPPCLGSEHYYGREDGFFGREDFEKLAELLSGLKGGFLMTLNDHPETRRNFAHFGRSAYSVQGKGKRKAARELLIQSKG
jgi:DNA adenine methylase